MEKNKKQQKDFTLKAEQGFHSNTLSYNLFKKKAKKQEEWEKELGIDAIRISLKEHGWETWQWSVHTQKEIKEHEYLTHFVEAFSPYYHGYLRGDSKLSLRDACEHILNQAQKFNACEKKTGHCFEPKKGYNNGLLSCKHCGFWGYSNLFLQHSRQVQHYKIHAEVFQKHEAEANQSIRNIGLGFNGFGGLLIKNINKEGYTFCNNEFMLNKDFLKDLWKLFGKYKLVKLKKEVRNSSQP